MMKKYIVSLTLLAAFQVGMSASTPANPGQVQNTTKSTSVSAAPKEGETVDFTLKDINGKDFKLSSLKGKYVVVDFWGSWCINCIKGFPKMKEFYANHKDQVEIVSVDCNDTDSRWKAAVAKHTLPWINVYNPRTAADVTKKLGISAFPTKILLDQDGKVVKTFVGEDDSFYTVLESTIK